MADVKIVDVPHLGGIKAATKASGPIDPSKPTLVLVNSFATSSELYRSQFADKTLTSFVNLLAIELLGHGQTRTNVEHFTYWDTAIMNLQVLDALNIKRAFVLGTSQGGWVTIRMALLAPDKIAGVIPLGTSMDYESERTKQLGCWDGYAACSGPIEAFTSAKPTPEFEPPDEFCDFLVNAGFGSDCDDESRKFWTTTVKSNYKGDDGRRRLRMAGINLRDRDGLLGRLFDVICPVLWIHGTSDVVYSVANAQEEIKMFVNSSDANLVVVEGGQHFLNFSHPTEVNDQLIKFIKKHS